MIYDLDAGRPERPPRSSWRMTAVTVGAVGLALAFFTVTAFRPGDRDRQTPLFSVSAPLATFPHPSFATKPVPDRTLVLPTEIATVTFRITSLGQTGLVSNDAMATTYRLRASGDLVTVMPLPPSETLPYPPARPGDVKLRVRGRDAESMSANGTTAIRWLENDIAFEMSSRTLSVAQLADLATKLR